MITMEIQITDEKINLKGNFVFREKPKRADYILYLADRNILVDQSIQQDFAPLEKVIYKINVSKDDKSTITSQESIIIKNQKILKKV